jgi:hypothetical protein
MNQIGTCHWLVSFSSEKPFQKANSKEIGVGF